MQSIISELRSLFHQRWFVILFLLTLVPLFPEYVSFFLTAAAFLLSLRLRPSVSFRQQLGFSGGWIGLYILYMLISVLYSSAPLFSLATVGMWLSLGLGYLALTAVLTSRERIRTFCRLITLTAGLLGLLALLQAVAYHVFHFDISPRFWDFLDLTVYKLFPGHLELTRGQHRSAATFNNPNLLCEYLSMVMPVVLYTLLQETKELSYRMWLYLAASLLAVAGVIFSMSRGGYMALFTVLLIFIMSRPQRIIWIAAGLLLGILLVPSSVMEKFFTFSPSHGDFLERFEAWKTCLQAFWQRPVFGFGAGCGSVQTILVAGGIFIPHAHNLIIELITEGGLIALLFFAVLGIHVLRGGFRLAASSESHWIGMTVIAFAGSFFVHGLVDYPLLTPKLVQCFLLMIGFFECSRRVFPKKS